MCRDSMWESSYRHSARRTLFAGARAPYRNGMRRILIWLFGVPLGLIFLTAWSLPSQHYVKVVNAPVVDQRHHG